MTRLCVYSQLPSHSAFSYWRSFLPRCLLFFSSSFWEGPCFSSLRVPLEILSDQFNPTHIFVGLDPCCRMPFRSLLHYDVALSASSMLISPDLFLVDESNIYPKCWHGKKLARTFKASNLPPRVTLILEPTKQFASISISLSPGIAHCRG